MATLANVAPTLLTLIHTTQSLHCTFYSFTLHCNHPYCACVYLHIYRICTRRHAQFCTIFIYRNAQYEHMCSTFDRAMIQCTMCTILYEPGRWQSRYTYTSLTLTPPPPPSLERILILILILVAASLHLHFSYTYTPSPLLNIYSYLYLHLLSLPPPLLNHQAAEWGKHSTHDPSIESKLIIVQHASSDSFTETVKKN